jgi:hypothetical protein
MPRWLKIASAVSSVGGTMQVIRLSIPYFAAIARLYCGGVSGAGWPSGAGWRRSSCPRDHVDALADSVGTRA